MVNSIEVQLNNLSDAWGRRDLDAVMKCFAPDAVYFASIGPCPGEKAEGHGEIRQLIEKMFASDAGTTSLIGYVEMMENSAFWTWRYEHPNGELELGCDFFRFEETLITLKDAYRKQKPTAL